jgi:hypothetical protein
MLVVEVVVVSFVVLFTFCACATWQRKHMEMRVAIYVAIAIK